MPRPLHVGGLTPCSSIDWPGQLAAVVFVAGCPWRCHYCHNPHLQSRTGPAAIAWEEVLDFLARRRGLLDAVVFSGGEACADPALPQALDAVRAIGFASALHTSGAYPSRLAALLERVDWVGLDIKTSEANYAALTGVAGSGTQAWKSLSLLQKAGVAHEVRITAHPNWLSLPALHDLIARLADAGVRDLAVQGAHLAGQGVATDYLAALDTTRWQRQFSRFTIRA